ncbi:riboflavin biosynthesis protein RibD, partial [Francisella tularensis subsp. holarctica]|nr:riboflavin biosynthesis protein RibD [Francisella tularensis subsp. holarctica]
INITNRPHSTRFILANPLTTIYHNWRVLDQRPAKTIFVCSKISARVATKLNQLGIDYWLLPQSQHQVCLDTLLEKMGKIGIPSLLVEGG